MQSVDMTFATQHDVGIDFCAEPYFNDRIPFAGRRAKRGRFNEEAPHIRRARARRRIDRRLLIAGVASLHLVRQRPSELHETERTIGENSV
jgi:hypothetical protein